MQLLLLLAYVGLCLLVAYAGRDTKVGFWGLLLFSVLLTPLVTAILTVLFRPRRKKKA
jgi:hypothetical protein